MEVIPLQLANKIVKGVHTDVINYEKPGRMILAQGSEVLHHVTPVLSKSRRYRTEQSLDAAISFDPYLFQLQDFHDNGICSGKLLPATEDGARVVPRC